MTGTAMRYSAVALAGGLAMATLPTWATAMAPGEVYSMTARPEISLPGSLPVTGAPPPRFEREGWARAQLQAHGLRDVRGLSRVGDYWEAEARSQGRPVVAYLQDDGTLTFQHYPRAETAQAFGFMPHG